MSLKLYTVTLDLVTASDHRSLKKRLRTLDAKQILSGQWPLRSTYKAENLREILRGFLGDQDRIVVTEVGAERSTTRAFTDIRTL